MAQSFDEYQIGTEIVPMSDWYQDSRYGKFSGGSVERTGVTIDSYFSPYISNVYYGTELRYTNIIGEFHCCGWYEMAFSLSTTGDVLIEFFTHDDTPFGEQLMDQMTVSGQELLLWWGDRGGFQVPPGNPEITSIHWTSLDGAPFAIDDVIGVGKFPMPEPATWVMLITGFGLVGGVLRRQRRALA